MLGFINAQCAGAKNLTLQNLITFPWESENNTTSRKTEITKTDMEEFERMRKKADLMLKNNLI